MNIHPVVFVFVPLVVYVIWRLFFRQRRRRSYTGNGGYTGGDYSSGGDSGGDYSGDGGCGDSGGGDCGGSSD